MHYKTKAGSYLSQGPCLDHRFSYPACFLILSCYMFIAGFVKEICGCYYVQLSFKIFLVNLGAWPLLNALMENYSRVKLKRLCKYINKTLVKPKYTTCKSALKLSCLEQLMLLSALNCVSSLPDFHTGNQIELRKSTKGC